MILKEGKTNWIFIAIFIILSVIFGGEIIYNTKVFNKEISLLEKPLDLKIESVKKESPSFSKTTWQHYQNESFGISLDYPSDWEISLGSCSTPFWGVSGGCLKIEYKENKKCALYIAKVDDVQYQDLLNEGRWFGQEEVYIGEIKAIKIKDCCGERLPYLLKVKENNFVINIISPYISPHQPPNQNSNSSCPEDFQEKVDNILQSIKFIE